MIYNNLSFKKPTDRPFIFTDFVSTMDGKVFVKKDGYWPIGSHTDFEVFTFLRAHADAIIDGKGTAVAFGKNSFETFRSEIFRDMRKKLGKEKPVEHIIMTRDVNNKLEDFKKHTKASPPTFFTQGINKLIEYLNEKEYKTVFINGGPTLLASFLDKNLVDEIFLTIAPKIFGTEKDQTITMVEGKLFKPDEIEKWHLMSINQVEDEVYLRYRSSVIPA